MNKRIWIPIALILAAAAVTAGALHVRAARWARVDARRLVAQALSGEANSSYVARVTTITGYEGEVSESHATVYHQGSSEKIQHPGYNAPWSMTIGGKSYTYLPKGKRLLVTEMSKLLTDNDRTALLLANYNVRCIGMDTIAGRAAYAVEIRTADRPSKKLWIDRENSTILRTDDYSASGDKRGSTHMDSVSFSTRISPKTFALPSQKSVRYVMLCKSGASADLFKGLGYSTATPTYVPKGYKLEGYHLLYSTCSCGHHSAQLTYTDGLNVISVFQTPRMTSCCKMMGSKCDDQNCGIATQGQFVRGDRTIVVVGDLLPKDVRRIAESVR